MSVLKKSRHEQFALAVAKGESPTSAYASAFGSSKGAAQSASRLLKNANVSSRISELRFRIAEKQLKAAITDRNFRLQQLQNRHEMLNAVREARASEHRAFVALLELIDPATGVVPADHWLAWRRANSVLSLRVLNTKRGMEAVAELVAPGGETGWVLRDFRGKNADQVIFKEDLPLASELRSIEEQAAKECGQWLDKSELTIKDGDLAARLAAGRQRVAKARG